MSIKQGLDYHPDSRTSRWPPGTRHAYNNAGAAVAAYIVEKVTGQKFEDYVAQTFFAPLGMTSTSYFKTKLYGERGATLYQGITPQEYWQLIHRPAGSINSSARDMAKFLQFLLMRGSTADGAIVSEASFLRMETPGTLPGNTLGVLGGYGLANYTSGHRAAGVAFRGHNGGVQGGLTELSYVRELGVGYVFMINSGSGAAVARLNDLLRSYLLRDANAAWVNGAALPEQYRKIDGYYQAINPRSKTMRLAASLTGFTRVTHDETAFHRSPVFGSWTSSDYVGPRGVLIDRWSGLPSITIIEDPLVGTAIQVGSDLHKRVPAWQVFARFGTLAMLVLMSIAGFIAFFVWLSKRGKQPVPDTRLWLRLWPLTASAALSAYMIAWVLAGAFPKHVAVVSPWSIGLFVLSLVYPAAVLSGAANLFTAKARAPGNLPYWFAVVFAIVHLLVAGYMAAFGALGIRMWA
jgi:hypothetical protein